jgi:hypothetical protein
VRCAFGVGHAAATIDRLMGAIRAEAGAWVTEAAAAPRRYSPSDFSGVDLSQDELDALLSDL